MYKENVALTCRIKVKGANIQVWSDIDDVNITE
jgi:hypothetical protein